MEILVERIQCGLCNCYIVSQGESAVLVDTAITVYRRRILKRCRGRNVRLIILTHGHCDHAQNAAWLAEKLGVPVAMHPADVPLLRDPMSEPLRHTGFATAVMAAVLRMTRIPVLRRLVSFVNIRPFEPEATLCEAFPSRNMASARVSSGCRGIPEAA